MLAALFFVRLLVMDADGQTTGPTQVYEDLRLTVAAGFAGAETLRGYQSLLRKAKGELVAVTMTFHTTENPALAFMLSTDPGRSDIALMVGVHPLAPIALAGPTAKLDQIGFHGYRYQADDGRSGHFTFVSGTMRLVVFFDVPRDLSGARSLIFVPGDEESQKNAATLRKRLIPIQ